MSVRRKCWQWKRNGGRSSTDKWPHIYPNVTSRRFKCVADLHYFLTSNISSQQIYPIYPTLSGFPMRPNPFLDFCGKRFGIQVINSDYLWFLMVPIIATFKLKLEGRAWFSENRMERIWNRLTIDNSIDWKLHRVNGIGSNRNQHRQLSIHVCRR